MNQSDPLYIYNMANHILSLYDLSILNAFLFSMDQDGHWFVYPLYESEPCDSKMIILMNTFYRQKYWNSREPAITFSYNNPSHLVIISDSQRTHTNKLFHSYPVGSFQAMLGALAYRVNFFEFYENAPPNFPPRLS